MAHRTISTGRAPADFSPPPGPRGHPLWGVLPEYRADQLSHQQRVAREYGDVVSLRFLWAYAYQISHPDAIKLVLQDHNRNYGRDPLVNNVIKMLVGDSLFTTDGDSWLARRRLMQPMFHRQRVATFGTLMVGCAEALLLRWEALPAGQYIDVDREVTALTLRIAGKALFSVDLLGEASALGHAFTRVSEFFNYRLNTAFPPPMFVPTARNRRFRQAKQTIDATLFAMIADRRRNGDDRGDLLSMLLDARDADTGEHMTDEHIRNELSTMMFAGHETTATTLAWAFYLLSEHPEIEERLHRELDGVLNGRAPSVTDLPGLPYTRAIVDETLRLYPAAPALARSGLALDEIGGYRIPPHATIVVPIWTVHRDPRWWDDPEGFDPERFLVEKEGRRLPFTYMPFGGGPRLCIGNQFALTEAQLVLACIAQRYQLRLKPGHPVRPNPIFTLRTSHGLPMTLIRR